MLTSYRWRGVELNDGSKFLVPRADLTLDDHNPAEATFAYRGSNAPSPLGATIKEGVVTLPISISARHNLDQGITQLKQLFNTRDDAYYPLERKLPHESTYQFLTARPTEFNVNRTERKVVVTLAVPDRSWEANLSRYQHQDIFDENTFSEVVTVFNNGAVPVEPYMDIEPLSASATGYYPLYFRTVSAYVGPGDIGHPILLTHTWNTATLVEAEKMRSDGLDMTVSSFDGINIPRVVAGSVSDRRLWIKLDALPASTVAGTLMSATNNEFAPIGPTDTRLAVKMTWNQKPATVGQQVTIRIGGEIIVGTVEKGFGFPGLGWHNATLKDCVRGAYGTAADYHYAGDAVQGHTFFVIRYGYAQGFEQVFGNSYANWPSLNYDSSTTDTWVFDPVASPVMMFARDFATIDAGALGDATRAGEIVEGRVPNGGYAWGPLALSGFYSANAYLGSRPRQRLRINLPSYTGISPRVAWVEMFLKTAARPSAIDAARVEVWANNNTVSYGATTPIDGDDLYLYYYFSHPATTDFTIAYFGNHYIPGATSASQAQELLRLNRYVFHFDPKTAPLPNNDISSEQGPGTGYYGLYLEIVNLDDVSNPEPLRISCQVTTGMHLGFDCEQRRVHWLSLDNFNYARSYWLRLMPGANRIQFSSVQGTGDVRVHFHWKERY